MICFRFQFNKKKFNLNPHSVIHGLLKSNQMYYEINQMYYQSFLRFSVHLMEYALLRMAHMVLESPTLGKSLKNL